MKNSPQRLQMTEHMDHPRNTSPPTIQELPRNASTTNNNNNKNQRERSPSSPVQSSGKFPLLQFAMQNFKQATE